MCPKKKSMDCHKHKDYSFFISLSLSLLKIFACVVVWVNWLPHIPFDPVSHPPTLSCTFPFGRLEWKALHMTHPDVGVCTSLTIQDSRPK